MAAPFAIKFVTYGGLKRPILLQNENGPCPLLALINALSLRSSIIPGVQGGLLAAVERDWVTARLATAIVQAPRGGAPVPEGVLALLPSLSQVGLDVNPYFTDPLAFEYTAALDLFDVLGVRLVHGWVAGPDEPVAAHLAGLSFNALQDELVAAADGGLPDAQRNSQALRSPWRVSSGGGVGLSPAPARVSARDAFSLGRSSGVQQPAEAAPSQEGESESSSSGGGTGTTAVVSSELLDAEGFVLCSNEATPRSVRARSLGAEAAASAAAGAAVAAAPASAASPTSSSSSWTAVSSGGGGEEAGGAEGTVAAHCEKHGEAAAAVEEQQTVAAAGDEGGSSEAPLPAAEPPHAAAAAAAPETQPTPSTAALTPSRKPRLTGEGLAAVTAWFEETSSQQLTFSGLIGITAALEEGEVAVLFRGCHFSTLLKREGRLYVLCTDAGFADTGDAVAWELLDDIAGDTTVTDASFNPARPLTADDLTALRRQSRAAEAARNGGQAFPRYVLTAANVAVRVDKYQPGASAPVPVAAPPAAAAPPPVQPRAPARPGAGGVAAAPGQQQGPRPAPESPPPAPPPPPALDSTRIGTGTHHVSDAELAMRLQQEEMDAAAREEHEAAAAAAAAATAHEDRRGRRRGGGNDCVIA